MVTVAETNRNRNTGECCMKKSVKGARKKSIPNKKSVRAVYDCDDVEKYLDQAIERVKDEIVPKIDAIDERDKMQYDMAKKIMVDAAIAAQGRQEAIQNKVDTVGKELQEIYESRKEMVHHLTSSFDSLHNRFEELHTKLDQHIFDESTEFAGIREGLTKAATHVEAIQQTLDNVSANGKKGLTASFTDIYEKVKDVESATAGVRARAKFWKAMSDMIEKTALLKPLKFKVGWIVYGVVVLLAVSGFLHLFGVNIDLLFVFKWIFGLAKGG